MNRNQIYSLLGQLLMMAVLGLAAASLFWSWNTLSWLARLVFPDSRFLLLALASVLAWAAMARHSISAGMLLLMLAAGVDRLFLAGAGSLAGTLAGGGCLLLAGVILTGMLSERFGWARKCLPGLLMVILGLLFFAPVALIARAARLAGLNAGR